MNKIVFHRTKITLYPPNTKLRTIPTTASILLSIEVGTVIIDRKQYFAISITDGYVKFSTIYSENQSPYVNHSYNDEEVEIQPIENFTSYQIEKIKEYIAERINHKLQGQI